jgi:HlyD family secretion protein
MSIDEVDRDRAFEVRRGETASRRDEHTSQSIRRAAKVAAKVVAVAVLLAAGAWAWYANRSSGPAMDMSMRVTSGSTPFPVTLAAVERGPVAGVVTYTGSVAPLNEEDVFPRVTGRIVEIPVYPGDAVRAGQVVARLDDVELGSRAREAEAGAVAATATAAQMEADVVAARHGVVQMERELAMSTEELRAARDTVAQMENEVTMAQADSEHQGHIIVRDERLYASGGISLQELEATRAMVTGARAKVDGARSKVSQMNAMVSVGQAKVDAARARLDQAKAMEQSALRRREAMVAMASQSRAMQRTAEVVRDYVNIRSPSGGYVVKRLVAPGVLVQPGMAILKIAQIDRVRLQANVGEKDLASIKVGSPVKVTAAGAGQAPITARVTSVFPFVDAGARTGVVEALVENTPRRFLPGQYVQMEFVTGERPDALTVPRDAVARMGGKARVWVADGDRTQPREVTTGLEGPDRIEVVTGLAGTERVVARGHEGLYAGARIAEMGPGGVAPRTGAGGHQHGAPAGGGDAGASSAPAKGEMPGMPGMSAPPSGREAGAGPGGGERARDSSGGVGNTTDKRGGGAAERPTPAAKGEHGGH